MKFKKNLTDEPEQEKLKRIKQGKEGFRLISIVEVLIFLVIAFFIDSLFHPILSFRPHPLWIIIILIPLRYGLREGIVCALITSVVYTYFVLFPKEGVFYFSTLKLFQDFKMPLLFLIVAMVIGEYH